MNSLLISPLRNGDARSAERILAHYLVEREQADRLRNASKDERKTLYTAVYDEMLRRVPDHPRLTRKHSPGLAEAAVREVMRPLLPMLNSDMRFLEIGAGSCALSIAVAPHVRRAIAYEVSNEIVKNVQLPENCCVLIGDGTSIALPDASVDFVFSNQLMEHIHPDDALAQLMEIRRVLAPNGRYLCITPNAVSGPHDVSLYFDNQARGFHLKEYTIRELSNLFKSVGFHRTHVLGYSRGFSFGIPLWLATLVESILNMLPHGIRRTIGTRWPLKAIVGIRIMGLR